jgi:hypothetical protein
MLHILAVCVLLVNFFLRLGAEDTSSLQASRKFVVYCTISVGFFHEVFHLLVLVSVYLLLWYWKTSVWRQNSRVILKKNSLWSKNNIWAELMDICFVQLDGWSWIYYCAYLGIKVCRGVEIITPHILTSAIDKNTEAVQIILGMHVRPHSKIVTPMWWLDIVWYTVWIILLFLFQSQHVLLSSEDKYLV